eukprot:128169_1
MSVFLAVYSMLIIQLIYFLISTICYLYHNQQYRVFWAAFYIDRPPDATDITSHTCDSWQEKSIHTASTDLSSSRPSILSGHTGSTTHIQTKRTAFIHFGLETLSHSILMPLYLICILFSVCVRLAICYITFRSIWAKYRAFCSYQTALFVPKIIAHYSLQIMMCIPALKIQYLYNSSKCQRRLPVASILCMIIFSPIEILETASTISEVKQYDGAMTCLQTSGIGMNPYLSNCIVPFGYYLSFVLCFGTVIIPIYVQRKMLMNMHPNSANLALLTKMNALSKRVCVSAVVMISMFVIINSLYRMFTARQPWLSPIQWSLYAQGYLVIVFIYKDWRIRLCPLCSYNHVRMPNCLCREEEESKRTNGNQMSIELVSASQDKSSSVGVPNLVRDVSKDEIKDATFS